MEMRQLANHNAAIAQQFANDLVTFIKGHLPPALHVRPHSDLVKLKKEPYVLAASKWFRTYFLASREVSVSSAEYLTELLED
jgi:hypothetical protein